jgi:hypothetical protein
MMPSARTEIVTISCSLLKPSLSTSNVFEGATFVKNRSNPKAKTMEVDSRRVGDVVICLILET